jgi:formate-nitrite transporter family protein
MADQDSQSAKRQEHDAEEVLTRSAIGAHVVYEAIMVEGEEELKRSNSALAYSGIAAGLSMGFSLLGQGLLQVHLPDHPWRPLLVRLGYCTGFLIVVLGRQQLFTENTLTPVLPLLRHKKWRVFLNVMRLWGVVLLTNLAGTTALAYVLARTDVLDAGVRSALLEISRPLVSHTFGVTMLRGVVAGWIIALMVWVLPYAEAARVWVIILMTYLVGLGTFTHVIAGSVDVAYLVAAGEIGWDAYAWRFLLPALLGNVLGGVALVAALNHAQVTAGNSRKSTIKNQFPTAS